MILGFLAMYIKFYISQDRLGYTAVTIKPKVPMA